MRRATAVAAPLVTRPTRALAGRSGVLLARTLSHVEAVQTIDARLVLEYVGTVLRHCLLHADAMEREVSRRSGGEMRESEEVFCLEYLASLRVLYILRRYNFIFNHNF